MKLMQLQFFQPLLVHSLLQRGFSCFLVENSNFLWLGHSVLSCLFISLYKRMTKGFFFFVLFVCFLLSGPNTTNILHIWRTNLKLLREVFLSAGQEKREINSQDVVQVLSVLSGLVSKEFGICEFSQVAPVITVIWELFVNSWILCSLD